MIKSAVLFVLLIPCLQGEGKKESALVQAEKQFDRYVKVCNDLKVKYTLVLTGYNSLMKNEKGIKLLRPMKFLHVDQRISMLKELKVSGDALDKEIKTKIESIRKLLVDARKSEKEKIKGRALIQLELAKKKFEYIPTYAAHFQSVRFCMAGELAIMNKLIEDYILFTKKK